ncbi:class I SAM-dependent methyltransferase [Salicola sp. Rm-C-2C1-2]|uniref:class I SAM-dependent methyltransferase n=1 Tax=Salicola sp. Rm-C-2C1-2 TaxID=3141321 RepID=UPI0032E4D4B7
MIRSLIYDTLILKLTSRWYAEVLSLIPARATVLDVGIGTAGALLANAEHVTSKQLQITGIDIDGGYVARARPRLSQSSLKECVMVYQESVYDHRGGPYDVIYFSASFMLLPDPEQALRHCCTLLNPGGRIVFTQTIQHRRSQLMEAFKPLLRRLTSIDFGQVTYAEDFRAQIQAAGLELVTFDTLETHGNRASCRAVAVPASH